MNSYHEFFIMKLPIFNIILRLVYSMKLVNILFIKYVLNILKIIF